MIETAYADLVAKANQLQDNIKHYSEALVEVNAQKALAQQQIWKMATHSQGGNAWSASRWRHISTPNLDNSRFDCFIRLAYMGYCLSFEAATMVLHIETCKICKLDDVDFEVDDQSLVRLVCPSEICQHLSYTDKFKTAREALDQWNCAMDPLGSHIVVQP